MKKIKLPPLAQIHSYLEKPKTRGWILFPPLLFIIIGIIIGFCAIVFDFSVYSVVFPIYLFFVGYLIIGFMIIKWSDFKRIKKGKKQYPIGLTKGDTTVDPKYIIAYDTYDDDQYTYMLAMKEDGITKILLNKTYGIRNKKDKDQFEADINKLAEYFNCNVLNTNI